LAHAAEALAMLHGQGLAYGDLSAGNVLVSHAITEAEVWLIDSDNVAFLTALIERFVLDARPDKRGRELHVARQAQVGPDGVEQFGMSRRVRRMT
jgi:hypothetical protein